jgi:L-cysteine S-thiosulfotransferase
MKPKTAMLWGAGITALSIYANASPRQVNSGYTLLKQETRHMQDDDFMNPGMEGVARGTALFSAPGRNGKSCASCHGAGGKKFDVKHIAQYPVLDAKTKRPITLQQRILNEWAERLGNVPLKYESDDALALETFVRNLARGQVVAVRTDGDMAPFYDAGEKLYEMRVGQLNMACDLCHDRHVGEKLRAQVLSQGQTNGFPLYRLATGRLTGLQTRLTECYTAIRAEPYPLGSEEYTLLELYLNARGNGLKIETPAVRF